MLWVGLLITVGFLITAGVFGTVEWLPQGISPMLALLAPLIGGGTAARAGANPIRSSVLAVALGAVCVFAAPVLLGQLFGEDCGNSTSGHEQYFVITMVYLTYCIVVAGVIGWLRSRDLKREGEPARAG